jgi:hypothetical protein
MMERHLTAPNTTLVDILDRVLDKGLVVAGDIRVSLANVELLTIQVRLLVCSIDKAQEIGLDWWRHDRFLTSQPTERDAATLELQARVDALERQLTEVSQPAPRPPRRSSRRPQTETGGNHGG